MHIFMCYWAEVDSNHRSNLQQIYSLSPLATRESAHSSVLTDCIFIPHYTSKCKHFLDYSVHHHNKSPLADSLRRARAAKQPSFRAQCASSRSVLSWLCQESKKDSKAVFLEKVFLMGYLIKLQNVLGRLRDYNSKPFQIRKYQGFTKLTKTFACFCALSPIIKIHLINISCFIPLLLTKIRYRLAHRYLIFILLLFYLFRHK